MSQTLLQRLQSAGGKTPDDVPGPITQGMWDAEITAAKERGDDRVARGMKRALLFDGSEDPAKAAPVVPVPPVAPLASGGFCGIYDFNRQSAPDWEAMWAAGIRAVIHKVSEGTAAWGSIYHARRAEAKARGFLWGGYHFTHGGDVLGQVSTFLDAALFTADELIALDWEEGGGQNMTMAEAETFCECVKASTGRYPVVYGGGLLRDQIQHRPSAVLSQCPLWYVQVQAHTLPTQIPAQVWPNGATLHQYWSQDLEDQVPGIGEKWKPQGLVCNDTGCGGADRSRFFGTEAELRAAWPFTRRP
jgi:lysozyme